MTLEERVYSVLVVSSAEKINTALSSLLGEAGCDPVRFVSSVSAAKRVRSESDFDFIIVNSPLPDDAGVRFAIDAASAPGTVVLLMVKEDVFAETFDRVVKHGVFVLSRPVTVHSLSSAVSFMASARERLRRTEEKAISFEEKMAEIRLVNRAKWLLISELSMDEPQAHRYIEKQAMDRCVSRRDVAEDIIRTYS